MIGYASPSVVAPRRFSPTSIALIVAGHAALLALVVSAKMDIVPKIPFGPTILIPIENPVPPEPTPPLDPKPTTQPRSHPAQPTTLRPIVDGLPPIGTAPGGETIIPTGPFTSGEVILDPPPLPHRVLHRVASLATPERLLRPPYPLSKQRLGEEASLSLRLTIGTDGRVTAVEAAGPADPVFLAAARRHILANWRYRPATDDRSAVATVLTVQLSFKLDDAG